MNKKFLTFCTVLNGIFTLGILAMFAISLMAPQWLEELTSYLQSSDFNYELVGGIIICSNILITIILFFCNEVCYKQHCDLEDEKSVIHETDSEVQYKTRLHFGRIKKEVTDKGVAMKTREERKAEKLAKTEAARKAKEEKVAAKNAKRVKKVEKAVEEKVETVEKKVDEHIDSAVDSFIKSLKK